jgi:hypothetical protein
VEMPPARPKGATFASGGRSATTIPDI